MSPARPSIEVETLLADAGWVRRLAARLVADPGTADEIAQETLVAAWRHPPARGTPARVWLARVLRNFARQRSRADSARSAREQRRGGAPTAPDDLLERAELAQRLARIVLELDEPYRTTVLQRFFEDWSAEEIARASGTNASTVRTRLERALAQLRARLERERGREWMAAVMPLVPLKTGAGVLTGITGGIIVGTGTKLAIGLCVAALCGWVFWPGAEPPAPALEPSAPESARAPERVEAPKQAEPRHEIMAAAATPARQAPAAHLFPAELAPGTIEGVVVRRYRENELPIEGAEVALWPKSDDLAVRLSPETPPDATARTQADGAFRFAELSPGNYVVRARSGDGPWHGTTALVHEKGPGAPIEIVFGGTRIHGRVYDRLGAPLAGVGLAVEGVQAMRFELHAETQSGERGTYSFEELPAGDYYGMLSEKWRPEWPGAMWSLSLVDGDDVELDLGEPRPATHWRGMVRTRNGEPAKDAGTLHLERSDSSPFGSVVKLYREWTFQSGSSFDVEIETGIWQPAISLQSKPETRRSFETLEIGRDDLEHDLVLPGARLSGTVYDSVTLKPLAGYAGILHVSVSRPGPKYPSAFQTVEIDEGAHFVIESLDEGPWEISTFPLKVAALGARLEFTVAPGQSELQLDVQVQKP